MIFEAFAYSAACTITPNTTSRPAGMPGVIVVADEDDEGQEILASHDGLVGPEGSREISMDAADAALSALGYRRLWAGEEDWREVKIGAGVPPTGLWHCEVEKIAADA